LNPVIASSVQEHTAIGIEGSVMRTKSTPPLTERQKDLVKAVESLTAERGYPPSMREVAAHLGVGLTRAAMLAEAAVARGALTHDRHVARSWRVLKKPAR
jgi:SOS-response transcriptional repressor LexA